ncbi:hypothetical protein H2200_008220 [Cladophialophora chaetospira]|uniref:Uncharacterized protein n=1 Tax=Cladophialophora chaetospira TaxID=386627 RepID=A0AA39CGE4_9EURO|nr:hypothetical protein H2200_008220 [Cladophialophora chaetospira]
MTELGPLVFRMKPNDDCNVPNAETTRDKFSQAKEVDDAYFIDPFEDINDATDQVLEDNGTSRHNEPSDPVVEGSLLATKGGPLWALGNTRRWEPHPPTDLPSFQEAGAETTGGGHVDIPCAGKAIERHELRLMSMLDNFVAAPTNDIPDLFPRRLLEGNLQEPQVNTKLFEGQGSLQALVEGVEF